MRKIYVLSAFLLFAVSCSPDENPLTLSEPTTTLSEPTTTLSEPTTTLSEPTTTLSEPTKTTPPSTSTTKSPSWNRQLQLRKLPCLKNLTLLL